jgi:hypothetical protein
MGLEERYSTNNDDDGGIDTPTALYVGPRLMCGEATRLRENNM